MKHFTTYILLFLTVTASAQMSLTPPTINFGFGGSEGDNIPIPETNLNFYWDGGISAIDSTLLNRITGTYDLNFKLLSFDGSLDNNYLSTKSTTLLKVYGDTVPVVCLFQNYNYADTLFFKQESQTINTDSTEIYPQRISEIAHYTSEVGSADSITLWTYFSIPKLATNGYVYVGAGANDSATIELAISGASANDTIYVKTGIYRPATTLAINKVLTIIGIGKSEMRTAAGTYAVQFSANGIIFKNFMFTAKTVSGIYMTVNNGHTVSNCYLTGFTTNCIWDRTSGNTFNNIYLNAQGSANALYAQANGKYYNFLITGTGTQNPIYVLAASGTPNIKYYWFDIQAKGTGSYTQVFRFRYAGVYNIKFSKIRNITPSSLFYQDASIGNTIYIEGNEINPTSCTSSLINFTASNNLGRFYLKNNTITNSTTNNTIYVDNFKYCYINGNTINNTGNAMDILVQDGVDTCIISENTISSHGASAGIIQTGDVTNGLETYYCLVEKNEIYGGKYFDPEQANTQHGIFNSAVINQITIYNKIYGSNLSVVYKGDSVNNTSALIAYNISDHKLLSKGQRNIKFYNNTVSAENYCIHIMNNNDVEPTDYDARGCDIQNNILYNNTDYPLIYIEHEECDSNLISDYNVFFNDASDSIALKQTVYMDLSTWQGEGFDINSYNSDPNFNSTTNPWPVAPSDAIDNGKNLGVNYDDGLNITTVWPSAIVSKQQGTNWEIGAYVTNDE